MKTLFRSFAILLLSVGAGFLAGLVLRPAPPPPAVPVEAPPSPAHSPSARPPEPKVVQERIAWSQLESEDLRQLMSNLRRVSCPEETISDLARARILAQYEARLGSVFSATHRY